MLLKTIEDVKLFNLVKTHLDCNIYPQVSNSWNELAYSAVKIVSDNNWVDEEWDVPEGAHYKGGKKITISELMDGLGLWSLVDTSE